MGWRGVEPEWGREFRENSGERPILSQMLRSGHAVALCVLALLTLGVVMVSSAAMSVHAREAVTFETIVLSRHSLNMGLAIAAMGCCAFLPIRRLVPASIRSPIGPSPLARPILERSSHRWMSFGWMWDTLREQFRLWPLWLGVLGLVAVIATVYAPGIQRPRNGSHRWITLHLPGLDSLQPSEIAKWGMIALISWYGARYAARMKSFWLGLLPGMASVGVVSAAIVVEDLGTGVLVACAACVVLVAAGARIWQFLIMAPLPLVGIAAAILTSPYRMHRIESFLNPYLDPEGKGYHMIQSMAAVANGQITGRGLGHGLQKFEYLPEDTTDFLFAIICEELGVFGAALVLSIMAMLVWSIWSIVRRERWPVLKLFGLGVMATIGIQAVINLAVVTGLGPTKGIALPLLSSGGTGWILTAAALGLVIATDRTQHLAERAEREVADRAARQTRSAQPAVEVTTDHASPAQSVAIVQGELFTTQDDRSGQVALASA